MRPCSPVTPPIEDNPSTWQDFCDSIFAKKGNPENSQKSLPLHHPDWVMRYPEFQGAVGLKKSSICNRLNPASPYHDPSFPKPFPLSGASNGRGAKGWLASEVFAWINARRDAASRQTAQKR